MLRRGARVSLITLQSIFVSWFLLTTDWTGSPEIALVFFAALAGTALWCAVHLLRWALPRLFPIVWPRIVKAWRKSLNWQVKRVFEWAKWHGQRQDSVRYMVLCAIAVSIAVTIWIKMPLLRPFVYVYIPVALFTFGIFGWLERGERCTFLRFVRSFYVPTLGYSAAAAVSALGLPFVGL